MMRYLDPIKGSEKLSVDCHQIARNYRRGTSDNGFAPETHFDLRSPWESYDDRPSVDFSHIFSQFRILFILFVIIVLDHSCAKTNDRERSFMFLGITYDKPSSNHLGIWFLE